MVREGGQKILPGGKKIEADFMMFEATKFKMTMMMIMINRT